MAAIDPRAYDKTRNHLNGNVTWLSPFLTHGISNTCELADAVLQNHSAKSAYRFLFELAWREYFHRTWQRQGNRIFSDMNNVQTPVLSEKLPQLIVNANTGIEVIDDCINQLIAQGTMHNHARMWIAAITCNMAGTHWQQAARWMHYHLLDGDLASNTLSWQWVAGTFSHKKYVANQQNVNKYSNSEQTGSWLDVPYEAFDQFSPPAPLLERAETDYTFKLPGLPITALSGDVALRSLWQLDPHWQRNIEQHIVFVDTDLACQWPMSAKRWRFIEHWAEQCQATIVHGTLEQLNLASQGAQIVREEYPACENWPGDVTERAWLYPLPDSELRSFSQFFKQVKHTVGL